MARQWFADEGSAAQRIAQAAGRLLLALRQERSPGKELAEDGDRQSQAFIASELANAYPDDAILSEEAADDKRRLGAQRVWIIDPLDGSREFGEGRKDWAVHVAFLNKQQLAAGAVALPSSGITFSTLDNRDAPGTSDQPIRIMVSRTRPPEIAKLVAQAIGAELVGMGSAGYKAMAVVQGEAEAYIHAGGQYEWDLAAPAAVALATGLHVSRLDGSPLLFNQPSTWLPDVLICQQRLAPKLLDLLRQPQA